MRTDKFPRPPRPLRVREFTAIAAPKKAAKKPPKDGGSRFVGPYYFKAEEQTAIIALLAQGEVGDDEGRRLFTNALEYEIATMRRESAAPSAIAGAPLPSTSQKQSLDEIKQSAQVLLQTLQQTEPAQRQILLQTLTESDRFGRQHDERYLDRLTWEIERLAQACAATDSPTAKAGASDPHGIALILQVARIYQECLEVRMHPKQFHLIIPMLEIIRESAQIDIPTDPDTLKELLLRMP
jgi:hypothetical protein